MNSSTTAVLTLSALALGSVAGASASLSFTIGLPLVQTTVRATLPVPCQQVQRLMPDGRRFWVNTCTRPAVAPRTPPANVVYTQPFFAPYYDQSYDYGNTYSYSNGATYSYPVRPAVYQSPTHTTIYNTDIYNTDSYNTNIYNNDVFIW